MDRDFYLKVLQTLTRKEKKNAEIYKQKNESTCRQVLNR